MQPKGLGRQTHSDDSGARKLGSAERVEPGDAIKQEQLVVLMCLLLTVQSTADTPDQTLHTHRHTHTRSPVLVGLGLGKYSMFPS